MTSYDMTSSRVGTLAWAERTGGILSRGDRIGLLGDAVRLQMRILPAQTRALLAPHEPPGSQRRPGPPGRSGHDDCQRGRSALL